MALARRPQNGPRTVAVRLRADVDLGVSGSRAPITAADNVASEGLERGCSAERREDEVGRVTVSHAPPSAWLLGAEEARSVRRSW
jgi:hypothetical protein